MLEITIPTRELYDDRSNRFITIQEQVLCLEHSLVSISKWESKWCKPFISKEKKTLDETIDYIKCMTLTPNVNPIVYVGITDNIIDQINKYIDESMTATTFSSTEKRPSGKDRVTNEEIYDWMITLDIPFECENWHLNRLLTLIRVRNVKSQPPKKKSQKALLDEFAALNAARLKKHNSKG
jgi:hypothetical protein